MFNYWETYTVYYNRHYDENELQKIANQYDDYINDYAKYHNTEKEDDINSFSDYVLENLSLSDDFCKFDYDFDDSNIQELYIEIKKYM